MNFCTTDDLNRRALVISKKTTVKFTATVLEADRSVVHLEGNML